MCSQNGVQIWKGFNQKTFFYRVWHKKVSPLARHFLCLTLQKTVFRSLPFQIWTPFWKQKAIFCLLFFFFFGKNFLGFSRNFFTQSWVSKVCNTTLWMDPSKICSAFQVIDIPICHYNVISLPRQGINQHSFVLNFPLFLDPKIAFCTRWRSALPHIVEDIAQWTKTWKTIVIFIQQFRLNYSCSVCLKG